MSKYKALSVGTLPRVFINLLAMECDDITSFAEAIVASPEMKTWIVTTKIETIRTLATNDDTAEMVQLYARADLASFFQAVLNLSKVSRGMFVKDFDRLLNELGQEDFWGTEGQCDPRGDRRELDSFDD